MSPLVRETVTGRFASAMSGDEFFDSHIRQDGCCVVWTGTTTKGGYGRLAVANSKILAHRYAYQRASGPIPAGMTLDHLCKNTACVNPEHLEPVSLAENILRGDSPAAKHARQTECSRGHPFTPTNIYWTRKANGRRTRSCRVCALERYRQKSAARRTEAVG